MLPKERKGNHRNMTFQEEEEFLSQFYEKAKLGEIIEISEIKKRISVFAAEQIRTFIVCFPIT